jgi:hypothetical protein
MNSKHDQFADQLRKEATANSPDFSPLLHARIMRRIQPGPAPLSPKIAWRMSRLVGAASAIAAAALLALAIHEYQHRLTQPGTVIAKTPPSLPPFDLRFPDLGASADSTLTPAQFGYLDRDAKNAVHYVMDQFDVIPQTGARRG